MGYPHNYPISNRPEALPPQAAAGARQSCMCRRRGHGRRRFDGANSPRSLAAAVAWPVLAHAQQGDHVLGPGQARLGPVARGSHGLIRCHA